jgi:hypothetical protein
MMNDKILDQAIRVCSQVKFKAFVHVWGNVLANIDNQIFHRIDVQVRDQIRLKLKKEMSDEI